MPQEKYLTFIQIRDFINIVSTQQFIGTLANFTDLDYEALCTHISQQKKSSLVDDSS